MPMAILDPVALPVSEEAQARELYELLARKQETYLVGKGGKSRLELPEAVRNLLLQILDGMQRGKAISVVPVMQDLTTQQAAEMLGVSRPFLVGLLGSGAVPFHMVGTHRRVYLRDLLAYKAKRDRARHGSIQRIAQTAQKSGHYDAVLLPEE